MSARNTPSLQSPNTGIESKSSPAAPTEPSSSRRRSPAAMVRARECGTNSHFPRPRSSSTACSPSPREEDHQDFVDVHLTPPTSSRGGFLGRPASSNGLAAPPGVQVTKHPEELIGGYEIDVSPPLFGAISVGSPDRVTTRRAFSSATQPPRPSPSPGRHFYSMTSADHAAREIDPDRPTTLAAYERAWRDDLEREQELGRWIRRATRCRARPTARPRAPRARSASTWTDRRRWSRRPT